MARNSRNLSDREHQENQLFRLTLTKICFVIEPNDESFIHTIRIITFTCTVIALASIDG